MYQTALRKAFACDRLAYTGFRRSRCGIRPVGPDGRQFVAGGPHGRVAGMPRDVVQQDREYDEDGWGHRETRASRIVRLTASASLLASPSVLKRFLHSTKRTLSGSGLLQPFGQTVPRAPAGGLV